jgi:succinate---hydroxymethylglutarate CoA-transferase
MNGPLDGVRVVDLTRVLAGPLATMLLADLGADVVKIERPGRGDDTRAWGPPFLGTESAYFLGVNRNKRSVTLDLGREAGRELLGRLLSTADAVIDNFKLGTLDGWGFDDAWFDEHAPRAVRCSITGYGSTGPKAGEPGYDFILQAESGLMAITGDEDGEPMKYGVAIVDVCTGLLAANALLAGLQERTSTGRGRRFEVTLHDTSLMMLANVAANFLASGAEPARYGNGHPNIVPYRTFRASDGDFALSVGNDAQFAVLAELLGHREWAEDERFATNAARVTHRGEIEALLNDAFAADTREHWAAVLREAGIPSGPINAVSEALSSPQARGRGMLLDIEHPVAGTFSSVAGPIRYADGPPPEARLAPPLLGEHVEDVLVGELGLSADELDRLRADGIV